MTRLRLMIGGTIAAALVAAPRAQAPVFHSAVDLVQLDVSVTRGTDPVAGLDPRDFVVLDNGVRRDVATVSVEEVPLNFIAVLDTSDSVRGPLLADLRDATHAAVDALDPDDLASFVVFSHELTIRRWPAARVGEAGPFLDGLTGSGGTALYDAVHAATLLPVPNGYRSALLVFSDGKDSASWLSADDAIDAVRRSDAVVHVVTSSGEPRGFLDDLARAGGGRRWDIADVRDLKRTFLRVMDDLRVRYRLTVDLPEAPAPGWHALDVSVTTRGATVIARPGYFVP